MARRIPAANLRMIDNPVNPARKQFLTKIFQKWLAD
jgi:hypothetical protein